MLINNIKENVQVRNKSIQPNTESIKQSVGENKTHDVCSKEAAQALFAQNQAVMNKIPDIGKIPDSVIKKCSTGDKGRIINIETGETVPVTASIRYGQAGFKVLEINDSSGLIGYATFKKVDKENPVINVFQAYLGDTGGLYVEYMQSHKKHEYKHVGTLMHRILHEISKEMGCEGKMILDSVHTASSFHYDSGFKPSTCFNPPNKYFELTGKILELEAISKYSNSACNMYLPFENMSRLENGEHCIPKELLNMSFDKYLELVTQYEDERRKEMKNL